MGEAPLKRLLETAETYSGAAATYDRGRLGWYRGVLSLVKGKVGEPMLDAGCGTGYVACCLARAGLTDIACLDLSPGMVRATWRRARRWGVDAQLHPIRAALPLLPFRPSAFRTAIALAVVHHLLERELRVAALRELRTVAEAVIVTVWRLSTPGNLLRGLLRLSSDVNMRWGGRRPRYYHLYTSRELRGELGEAGYTRYTIYTWDYARRLFKRNIVVEYHG